jgi:hypothetical protein
MLRRSPSLLLLLALTGCVGGIVPVKIRPGSNIALPDGGSLVDNIVGSLLCAKGTNPPNGAQCGQFRIDSLLPRSDTPLTPPAKRP